MQNPTNPMIARRTFLKTLIATLGAAATATPQDVSAQSTVTPNTLGAISWHNAEPNSYLRQIPAALFTSASSHFLSLPNPSWLDGLEKLSFELSFMVRTVGTAAVSNGLVGRWDWAGNGGLGEGQFAIDTQTNTGGWHLRMWIANARTDKTPIAANGTALIVPYHYYHLVVVYDGSQPFERWQDRLRFYLNGVLDPIAKFEGGDTIHDHLTSGVIAPLTIAQSIANGGTMGSGFFDGAIWRVRFWPGIALNANDAFILFNKRKGYSFASIPPDTANPKLTAQPDGRYAWELDEVSGNRYPRSGGANVMTENFNPSVPPAEHSVQLLQVDDKTGRGNTGVGMRVSCYPQFNKYCFRFPAWNPNDLTTKDYMLDIGLPAGPTRPTNCTVAALCMTTDKTKKLNWIHASYDYSRSPLLDDIHAWGGLVIDDNHELHEGSVATFCGDSVNGNVCQSQALLGGNINYQPLRLIAVFTEGNGLATVYVNGARLNDNPGGVVASEPGNGGVYKLPQPQQANGVAGNSFIGNMADPTYVGGADHYIRDISLYDYAMGAAEVAQLDAYLQTA